MALIDHRSLPARSTDMDVHTDGAYLLIDHGSLSAR
jgi:hypothetical protein